MPVMIAEGKKYRLVAVAGEDPVWNVSVDEKRIALEVLRMPSAQVPTLFVRAAGRVISVALQGTRDQRVYFMEVNGRPLTITLEDDTPNGPTVESKMSDGPVLVNSPIAGKIASGKTSVDSNFEEGQSLLIF